MTGLRLSCLIAALLIGAAPAAAASVDGSVDGSWCAPDGRRISVDGTEVLTPGGQRTTGRYSLRAFTFALPAGEWQAGASIWMEPKGADAVRVSTLRESRQGPPPHDLWQRCGMT